MGFKSTLFRTLGYEKIRHPHRKHYPLDTLRQLAGNAPVRTILDIGANEGQTVKKLLQKFPEATIYCFEPIPETYAQLSHTYQTHPKVQCASLAMGNAIGNATFHINRGSQTSSLHAPSDQAARWVPEGKIEIAQSIEVETSTVDAFCKENSISSIDILKSDTQGHDLAVLQGAQRMLDEGRIRLVLIEVNIVQMYEGQAAFHEISAFLKSFGFRLFDLFAHAYAPSGQLKWADAIYALESDS